MVASLSPPSVVAPLRVVIGMPETRVVEHLLCLDGCGVPMSKRLMRDVAVRSGGKVACEVGKESGVNHGEVDCGEC